MVPEKEIYVDPLSACSLIVQPVSNDNSLARATGFCVEKSGTFYMITNWHVLSGLNPDTNQPLSDTGAVPDHLTIIHHKRGSLGEWVPVTYPLEDASGVRTWIEHPSGKRVDVAGLPIRDVPVDVEIYPLDLALTDSAMLIGVAMPVSIIGYPHGLSTAGNWPIWKTGHIASDPDLDYDGRPAFLVDVTGRQGMSGSPVLLRTYGPYQTQNGGTVLSGSLSTRFLGVYSGRIHKDAEIGRIWRATLISEILDNVT